MTKPTALRELETRVRSYFDERKLKADIDYKPAQNGHDYLEITYNGTNYVMQWFEPVSEYQVMIFLADKTSDLKATKTIDDVLAVLAPQEKAA
jgi:hypothetical protein